MVNNMLLYVFPGFEADGLDSSALDRTRRPRAFFLVTGRSDLLSVVRQAGFVQNTVSGHQYSRVPRMPALVARAATCAKVQVVFRQVQGRSRATICDRHASVRFVDDRSLQGPENCKSNASAAAALQSARLGIDRGTNHRQPYLIFRTCYYEIERNKCRKEIEGATGPFGSALLGCADCCPRRTKVLAVEITQIPRRDPSDAANAPVPLLARGLGRRQHSRPRRIVGRKIRSEGEPRLPGHESRFDIEGA